MGPRRPRVPVMKMNLAEQPRRSGAPAAIAGGTPADNAAVTTAVLRGEAGARRDIILANAAAALVAADIADDWRAGVELAKRAIDTGAAYEKLEALRAHTKAAQA